MKPTFHLITALGLVLVLSALCSAASYNVTDLGTLGGDFSAGYGINASGQVVGESRLAGGGPEHAFLRT